MQFPSLATAFSSMEQGLINFYVNDTIDYLRLKGKRAA